MTDETSVVHTVTDNSPDTHDHDDHASETAEEIQQKKEKLQVLESLIKKNLDSFLDVVIYMQTIQAEGLWIYPQNNKGEQKYKTFEQYTKQEFQMKRAYYSKLKSAAEAYKILEGRLSKKNLKKIPKRCAVLYELSRLEKGELVNVAEDIKQNKGLKNFTATEVRKIYKDKYPKKEKTQKNSTRQLQNLLGLIYNLGDCDLDAACREQIDKKYNNNSEDIRVMIDNLKKLTKSLEKALL